MHLQCQLYRKSYSAALKLSECETVHSPCVVDTPRIRIPIQITFQKQNHDVTRVWESRPCRHRDNPTVTPSRKAVPKTDCLVCVFCTSTVRASMHICGSRMCDHIREHSAWPFNGLCVCPLSVTTPLCAHERSTDSNVPQSPLVLQLFPVFKLLLVLEFLHCFYQSVQLSYCYNSFVSMATLKLKC